MPDDDRSTCWYYRVGGRETGPVLISRLRQLARKGQLAADDLVRKGTMGEWVAAGTIEELHAKARAEPTEKTPAAEGVAARGEDDAGGLSELGASFWRSVRMWYYDTAAAIGGRWWLLRRAGSIVALIVVVAVLLSVTVDPAVFDWSSPADPFATFDALWTELKEKRAATASEAEWAEFAARARGEIDPIVARLEKSAGSRDRSSQLLLWAGRDCLPRMLTDARTEVSPAERQFEEHLQSAKTLAQGQAIRGYNPAAAGGPWRAAHSWFASDPTGALFWIVMVPLDIGIVAWIGWIVVARRRRGA